MYHVASSIALSSRSAEGGVDCCWELSQASDCAKVVTIFWWIDPCAVFHPCMQGDRSNPLFVGPFTREYFGARGDPPPVAGVRGGKTWGTQRGPLSCHNAGNTLFQPRQSGIQVFIFAFKNDDEMPIETELVNSGKQFSHGCAWR